MRSTVAFLQSTWSGMHGGGVLIEPFMVHAFPLNKGLLGSRTVHSRHQGGEQRRNGDRETER